VSNFSASQLNLRTQRGQSSVLGIAFALILMTGVYTLYNVSQATTEKTNLVNATDAAAYSSAVQTARNLNYIAYTNRAMMANHISMGHLTSYWSWLQTADETVREIAKAKWVFALIPGTQGIATALDRLETATEKLVELNEILIPVSVGLHQAANTAILQSQWFYGGAAMSLRGSLGIDDIQRTILESYHPDHQLQTNFDNPVNSTKLALANGTRFTERILMSNLLAHYDAGDDDEFMKTQIESSIDAVSAERDVDPGDKWLRNGKSRDWRVTVPLILRMTKDGSTDAASDNGNLHWKTEDSFKLERFRISIFGVGWRRVFEHSNEANTYSDNDNPLQLYNGLGTYTSLAKDHIRPDCYQAAQSGIGYLPDTDCLGVTVIGRRDFSTIPLLRKGNSGVDIPDNSIYAIARAEIFFQRPKALLGQLADGDVETANLFNPFWKARLSD